jgi:putative transposase
MARMPRLYVEGCTQHIIQRGNNRAVCFYCDADYAFYLQKLREASETYSVDIHAFVLMTNHVHLLVTPSDSESVPRMMQSLGRCYVRYVNITYRRTGTLWEGRYKSCLVPSDDYFLAVSRYIELNPARAGMVNLPGEYPWSSYRHNGMGIEIGLIREHELYRLLGPTYAARVLAYRNLFTLELQVSLVEEIRLCTNKEWAVGRAEFVAQIEAALGRKVYQRQWGGDRRSVKYFQEL